MSDTNYHSHRSLVTKQGKPPFQFLPVVVQKGVVFVLFLAVVEVWIRIQPFGSGSSRIQVSRIRFASGRI